LLLDDGLDKLRFLGVHILQEVIQSIFGRPTAKRFPMLSDNCLSVWSVCDDGVLWPNCWMDHDATWCGGAQATLC